MSEENASKIISVRLPRGEFHQLEKAASGRQQSLSEYIRSAIKGRLRRYPLIGGHTTNELSHFTQVSFDLPLCWNTVACPPNIDGYVQHYGG